MSPRQLHVWLISFIKHMFYLKLQQNFPADPILKFCPYLKKPQGLTLHVNNLPADDSHVM